MGLSETIVAAMIGAIATVSTALFQLFTAFNARGKSDGRQAKKGTTLRSVLAVMALMIASAAGGFLYSELLRQRSGEDIKAMRQELRELRDLTAENARARGYRDIPIVTSADEIQAQKASVTTSVDPLAGSAESLAYVPPCRRSSPLTAQAQPLNASMPAQAAGECAEDESQRIALCGTIPSAARVEGIQLFAQPDAVQQPWSQHAALVEQDIGGARFTGKTFEYAQGQDLKAVCVNFMHWSSLHPHIARIVVNYRIGDAPEPAMPSPAPEEDFGTAPAAIHSDSGPFDAAPSAPQAAAFAPISVE